MLAEAFKRGASYSTAEGAVAFRCHSFEAMVGALRRRHGWPIKGKFFQTFRADGTKTRMKRYELRTK